MPIIACHCAVPEVCCNNVTAFITGPSAIDMARIDATHYSDGGSNTIERTGGQWVMTLGTSVYTATDATCPPVAFASWTYSSGTDKLTNVKCDGIGACCASFLIEIGTLGYTYFYSNQATSLTLTAGAYVWDGDTYGDGFTAASLTKVDGKFVLTWTIGGRTYSFESDVVACPQAATTWTPTTSRKLALCEKTGCDLLFRPCLYGISVTTNGTERVPDLWACSWYAIEDGIIHVSRDADGKWMIYVYDAGQWIQDDSVWYDCPCDVPGWTQTANYGWSGTPTVACLDAPP